MKILYERLDRNLHDRENFYSREQNLDHYLKQQAFKHQKAGGSVTHVAVEYEAMPLKQLYGYYTLVNNSISFERFPDKITTGLPRVYPIPTVKIARLARNYLYTEKGFGKYILIDAMHRIVKMAQETGIYAIDVDAINYSVKTFYEQYGFVELQDNTKSMIMTMKTVQRLLNYEKSSQEKLSPILD